MKALGITCLKLSMGNVIQPASDNLTDIGSGNHAQTDHAEIEAASRDKEPEHQDPEKLRGTAEDLHIYRCDHVQEAERSPAVGFDQRKKGSKQNGKD